MSKLITKARAGVTLVELLVVILIVTILSVSLLPLLKPFVVEAQYAAEAIPVIGNLRTKIGLYQYDKGNLPSVVTATGTTRTYADTIETWGYSPDGTAINASESDLYVPGWKALVAGASSSSGTATAYTVPAEKTGNWGYLIDVDNQDLVGKRCKPVHFQYAVVKNGSSYCYVLGCFGDNHGLPEGTGYAVCEICVKDGNDNIYKQIGTWKRYKAATDGQLTFGTITTGTQDQTAKKTSSFCPIPAASTLPDTGAGTDGAGGLQIVADLESYGWEF